jgi:hypothetical protein
MADRQALKLGLTALLSIQALAAADEVRGAEADLLKRATAIVFENYRSIQNYTCVETVQRDYYRPVASTLPRSCPVLLEQRQHPTMDMVLKLMSMDRLRLEVTTTEKGELLSWAGAKKFEEGTIDRIVREGPMGTGAFGSYLDVIFNHDVRTFVPQGETVVNGRRAKVYSFRVAASDSHYRMKLKDGNSWHMSAYLGEVLVDAETAEPLRLTLRTLELPLTTGMCQAVSTLDFSRVPMGGRDLVMASNATQRFIYPDGSETENTTRFSSCREYVGESSVKFFPEATAYRSDESKDVAPVAVDRIPSWIRFKMELTTPIDSDTAAHGDPFTGRLAEPLLDGKRVLAPRGARVEGRVSLLKVNYLQTPGVWFGLTPETIEIQGTKVPFPARLSVTPGGEAVQRRKGMRIYLPRPGEHSGTFEVPGLHAVLQRGFVSEWVTVPAPR